MMVDWNKTNQSFLEFNFFFFFLLFFFLFFFRKKKLWSFLLKDASPQFGHGREKEPKYKVYKPPITPIASLRRAP